METLRKFFSIIILFSLIVSGCSVVTSTGSEVPTETITPSPTSTVTITPTSTITLVPTATHTPSPTATPIGGGLGLLLFVGSSGFFPDHSQSIYSYDLQTREAQLILEGYNLEDVSPDGTQMLVSKLDYSTWVGVGNLYIADIDGTHLEEITADFHQASLDGKGAAWLEGDGLIVFRKKVNGIIQLFALNSLGETQQITQSSVGVLYFDPILADGKLIWEEGYSTRSGTWSHGLRLTSLNDFTTMFFLDWISDLPRGSMNILLSPDRAFIFYEVWGQDVYFGIADVNFNNVYEFTLNEILNDATFDGKFMVDSMFWLPDGQGIILFPYSCNPTCSLTKLIILAKNGEVQVDYDIDTLNNIMDVLWSPDGKMMIVSSYSRSDEGVIMKRYYEFNFLSGFEEFLGPELVDSELLTNLHWVP